MSSYREKRDQRIANDSTQDRALMCSANGCPNRWSVSGCDNGTCCSAHAWSDTKFWPQITQEQLDAQTERALRSAAGPEPERRADVRRLRAELAKLGEKLRANVQHPRAWAYRLKAREEAGEKLNDHQQAAWRAVVNPVAEPMQEAA